MVQDRVKVGEGAYATVYKQTFAVKTFADDGSDYARAELHLLQRCNHPRIIKCVGTYTDEQDQVNLLLPFYPQSLPHRLRQTMSHIAVQTYLRQLLEGVAYLHDQARIIHTDLKPQNLLLSSTNNLVICDFSCAIDVGSKDVQDNNCGTLWYRSPEVLLGTPSNVTCALDMWAVGCIIWEMLTKKPWFPGDSEIDQIFRIFRVCGTPSEADWPGVSHLAHYKTTFPQWSSVLTRTLSTTVNQPHLELLMHQMMVLDPKKRITAAAALKHPYFQDNVSDGDAEQEDYDNDDDDDDDDDDDE